MSSAHFFGIQLVDQTLNNVKAHYYDTLAGSIIFYAIYFYKDEEQVVEVCRYAAADVIHVVRQHEYTDKQIEDQINGS